MQRLSALDASFLDFEDAVSHMHIGSVGIFEGPAPPREELLAALAGRLDLVPRYRQVVRGSRLGLGRRYWVDDPSFDLHYHVRATAVPAPGEDSELQRVIARVMSHQLDRERPLWETWAVEGLRGGRWALLSKIHHCMVDGVGGSDLLAAVLDCERTPERAAAREWTPQQPPTLAQDLGGTLTGLLALPLRAGRALASPGHVLDAGQSAARGLLRLSAVTVPPPSSTLNGPLGAQRRWCWARTRLSDVRQVGRVLGGTVNDVVLACIAGGFRELLVSRGESTDRVVRTLVPVSVRSCGQSGPQDNHVSAMFADLPVSIGDPVARLHAVREQMAALKAAHEAEAGELLTSLAGLTPPMLLSLAERRLTGVPQHNVNTVTTNVPGPQGPLYACGRRMLESFPYVPLGGHVLIGVAIFTYDGGCAFGVTGDYDRAPDIDVLCHGIEHSLAEMLERSKLAPAGPRGRRRVRS